MWSVQAVQLQRGPQTRGAEALGSEEEGILDRGPHFILYTRAHANHEG